MSPSDNRQSPALQRLIDGRLAELRVMTFEKVLGLPQRTICQVTVGRTRFEVSEVVKQLPSGRLVVQIEAWKASAWRKPVQVHLAGVIFSSSGRVRCASPEELRELA